MYTFIVCFSVTYSLLSYSHFKYMWMPEIIFTRLTKKVKIKTTRSALLIYSRWDPSKSNTIAEIKWITWDISSIYLFSFSVDFCNWLLLLSYFFNLSSSLLNLKSIYVNSIIHILNKHMNVNFKWKFYTTFLLSDRTVLLIFYISLLFSLCLIILSNIWLGCS